MRTSASDRPEHSRERLRRSVQGHEDQFPPPDLSVGFLLDQETFARAKPQRATGAVSGPGRDKTSATGGQQTASFRPVGYRPLARVLWEICETFPQSAT